MKAAMYRKYPSKQYAYNKLDLSSGEESDHNTDHDSDHESDHDSDHETDHESKDSKPVTVFEKTTILSPSSSKLKVLSGSAMVRNAIFFLLDQTNTNLPLHEITKFVKVYFKRASSKDLGRYSIQVRTN